MAPCGNTFKNAAIYKCPADFNDFRTRSYSINNFICEGSSNTGYNGSVNVNQWKVYKITQVRDAAKTLAFNEETDTRGFAGASPADLAGQWNQNGWLQNPTAVNQPTNWVDTVPAWHRGGVNFTFVDGHAEYWKWSDPRTINYLKNDPSWPDTLYVTANNKDLTRVQAAICTWPQQRSN